MIDFTNVVDRKQIIQSFMQEFGIKRLDIIIVTFNRLPYLQKCIWSLIAGTSIPYNIHVFDDQSTDGTKEWLDVMAKRKLIAGVITAGNKMGTANAFNYAIDATDSNWFVFANDDMWFHRWWDISAMDIVLRYNCCGAVSMYDYTALNVKGNSILMDQRTYRVATTGLGATLFYRPLWKVSGGFILPMKRFMGFFATNFCNIFRNVLSTRNRMYQPIPHYVTHMDAVKCTLGEREYEEKIGYIDFRAKYKK